MLATREDFEYGVIAADGPTSVSATGCSVMACGDAESGPAADPGPAPGPAPIEPGLLAHLPAGSMSIELSAARPNRFLVVGGLPFGERLVMWWNFAGRTTEEIASARDSWAARDGRSGEVRGYPGTPWPPRHCRLAPSCRADVRSLRVVFRITDNRGACAVPSDRGNETHFTDV
jgi:hypothetical protein